MQGNIRTLLKLPQFNTLISQILLFAGLHNPFEIVL